MSLLRTASHMAVASSVHGRVQRRQQSRWAAADQAAAPVAVAPVAVAPVAPVAVAPVAPVPAPVAPAPVALDAIPDIEQRISLLQQLAQLHAAGVLTAEELAVQKARVLG